jgi:hypothetical protein
MLELMARLSLTNARIMTLPCDAAAFSIDAPP